MFHQCVAGLPRATPSPLLVNSDCNAAAASRETGVDPFKTTTPVTVILLLPHHIIHITRLPLSRERSLAPHDRASLTILAVSFSPISPRVRSPNVSKTGGRVKTTNEARAKGTRRSGFDDLERYRLSLFFLNGEKNSRAPKSQRDGEYDARVYGSGRARGSSRTGSRSCKAPAGSVTLRPAVHRIGCHLPCLAAHRFSLAVLPSPTGVPRLLLLLSRRRPHRRPSSSSS